MTRRKRPTKKATFIDPDDDDDDKKQTSGVTSMGATFKPKIGGNANPPAEQRKPSAIDQRKPSAIEQRKPSVIPAAMDRKESELAVPDFLKGAFDEASASNAQQPPSYGGYDQYAGQGYDNNQYQNYDNYNNYNNYNNYDYGQNQGYDNNYGYGQQQQSYQPE